MKILVILMGFYCCDFQDLLGDFVVAVKAVSASTWHTLMLVCWEAASNEWVKKRGWGNFLKKLDSPSVHLLNAWRLPQTSGYIPISPHEILLFTEVLCRLLRVMLWPFHSEQMCSSMLSWVFWCVSNRFWFCAYAHFNLWLLYYGFQQ